MRAGARAQGRGPATTNRIAHVCSTTGAYTISAGSLDPQVVLPRLLLTLRDLDPGAHARVTSPDGAYPAVPDSALNDSQDPWWSTDAAVEALAALIEAINTAAPPGFACIFESRDHLALLPLFDRPGAPTGACRPSLDPPLPRPPLTSSRASPPSVSGLRARVDP